MDVLHILKLLSVVFLGLYLIIVGLAGLGVVLSWIPVGLVGFFALASGVLILVFGVKHLVCCKNDTCAKP